MWHLIKELHFLSVKDSKKLEMASNFINNIKLNSDSQIILSKACFIQVADKELLLKLIRNLTIFIGSLSWFNFLQRACSFCNMYECMTFLLTSIVP